MYLLNMVEVFKTNIPDMDEFEKMMRKTGKDFCQSVISFDEEDCDKVVRVEGEIEVINRLYYFIKCLGYQCEILK